MGKVRILIILSSIWMACSCAQNEPLFIDSRPLLKHVKYDNEIQQSFTYTPDYAIKEEKSKHHYTLHTYDRNGKIKTSEHYIDNRIFSSSSVMLDSALNRKDWVNPQNTERSRTISYEYNSNGQLIKTTGGIDDVSFEYNNEGRIIRQTFFHNNVQAGYHDFEYDERGNLLKRKHYWLLDSRGPELQSTTEYEYDDQTNPFYYFKDTHIPGRNTNPNNIVKETYTLHIEVDPSIKKVQTTEYKYQYHPLGYPVKVNKTIEYIY